MRGNRQALRDISPHATLIYRKFVEFISRHDFAGAALLDRTLEPVMLVGQGWQADTRTLLKQRRSKGALSGAGMLPVRLQGERLLVRFLLSGDGAGLCFGGRLAPGDPAGHL